MKTNNVFLFLLIFLLSCSNSADTETETADTAVAEELEQTVSMTVLFPELFQYFNNQDSSFRGDGFESGEAIVKKDSLNYKVDTSQLKKFYAYLLFNADSSYALDLVSYNYDLVKRNGKMIMQELGPDFEASIVDIKNAERKRLLFFGPSGAGILDAKWEDATTLVMAGEMNGTPHDSLRPVMWKYNVKDKALQQFNYPNLIKARWSQYPKKVYELNK